MTGADRRIDLRLDRETAWTLRRLLLRFHRGAELEYGGRVLSDTEERRRRLEYRLADQLEAEVLTIMRLNGWQEEDEPPTD